MYKSKRICMKEVHDEDVHYHVHDPPITSAMVTLPNDIVVTELPKLETSAVGGIVMLNERSPEKEV